MAVRMWKNSLNIEQINVKQNIENQCQKFWYTKNKIKIQGGTFLTNVNGSQK